MPPKRTGVSTGTGTGLTPSAELSTTSTPKSGTPIVGAPSPTFGSLLLGKAPPPTRRSSRTLSDDAVQSEVPENVATSHMPPADEVNSMQEVPRRRGRPSKNTPKAAPVASQSPRGEDIDAGQASDVAPPDYKTSSVTDVPDAEPCPGNGQNGETVACPDVLTPDHMKSCTETAADDAESYSRNGEDGKTVACPDVLTADNAIGLEVIQLIDFWGPDGSKQPKSRVGTLEDPLEPNLKVGDRVLLLAPEEGDFGKHQLCYRHIMVVKEVGLDSDPAFHDQVKLKFEKFPQPKYDIWHPKRSWEMERITKERMKECQVFNKLYAKVKKYMSELNKRSHKDTALTLIQPKKHQKGFSSVSKDSSDKQGGDVPSEASAPSRQISAESDTSAPRKKRSSKASAGKDVTVSKSKQRAPSPSDSSDDEPIVKHSKALPVVHPAAAVAHSESLKTESKPANRALEAARVAKKYKKRAILTSSSSSSSASASESSSSSSSSQDAEYESDIGAKRKKSKGRQPGRTAAKLRESSAQPSQELREKPVLKIKKEEKKEKASDAVPSSSTPATKVSSDSSSLPSLKQHSQRPVSGPAANVVKAPVLSSSAQPDSARALTNIPKASVFQAIPRPLMAGGMASSSITAASIKPSVPVKELDLEQRWRERQAAASEMKRELPPLPSFHATSLPSLPALPSLPPLVAPKSKTPVAADKPAAPKVAPPSPIHKCVHAVFHPTVHHFPPPHFQVRVRPAFPGAERP
jgi:hypothetical protein